MDINRVSDLRGLDVDISTDVRTTIRELKPGDYYVPVRLLRRYGQYGLVRSVRRRTEDPFLSKTILGTTVKSYPSDRVHPVHLIVPDAPEEN
ncbi:hypothetical protein LCGC14_1697660 [marine sediment metagenome]|uniref:Uncharacterized protein n=1 Tax=marine sediment metagenome TaxID=412755 RepID=A0A0F9HJD4_9ZZZZ